MELPIQQQISEYLNRSSRVLIALPVELSIDRLAGAFALHSALRKLGKEVIAACSGKALPRPDFLRDAPTILPGLEGEALELKVSTAHAQLDELSYQTEEDSVRIFLKPRDGRFSPEDVTVNLSTSRFDAIITLGAQTLDDLGQLYQQHSDLFFDTPKINIDTNAGNEYFGTINLVEVTASSLSEILVQLIEALGIDYDEKAATALLGGIVASTHSFQDPATTPKALTMASTLIARGARQQDVIQDLYKTKDFSLLKLWGRALARIKAAGQGALLYSMLNRSDFEKTGESPDRLKDVMEELLENISGFQLVVLVGELEQGVRLLIAGLPHARISETAGRFTEQEVRLTPLFGLYQIVDLNVPDLTLTEAEQRLLQDGNA